MKRSYFILFIVLLLSSCDNDVKNNNDIINVDAIVGTYNLNATGKTYQYALIPTTSIIDSSYTSWTNKDFSVSKNSDGTLNISGYYGEYTGLIKGKTIDLLPSKNSFSVYRNGYYQYYTYTHTPINIYSNNELKWNTVIEISLVNSSSANVGLSTSLLDNVAKKK